MSQTTISNLDLTKLKIGKSGKMIKILYNGLPLQLSTSKMITPFGVKINNNNYSPFTNCHIDSSLYQNSNLLEKNLYDNLESAVIQLIKTNCGVFNQKDTDEIDFTKDDFYSPIFKPNKEYPKLLKISLPRDRNGNFDLVIFDENKQKIPLNDNTIETVLPKGTVFKSIIECNKVWAFKNKIGITWNLIQMKTFPQINKAELKIDYTQNLMGNDEL